MTFSARDAIFYHVFPLGFCGSPHQNDNTSAPVPRLEKLHGWLDHIQELGADTLLLGPVFESSTHGYDTIAFGNVDRRLGQDSTLRALADALHQRGMHLVLDAVFNHVGRDFFAFRDLREHGESSAFRSWFHRVRFGQRSPLGDPFTYATWGGFAELPKLNLRNPDVQAYFFDGVRRCVNELGVDGFRLDAADELDRGFVQELSRLCRGLRSDLWLMGEMIHGDYRQLANPEMLDSVTNYELYKGLWSGHVDRNYHEIAASLDRQSGPHGLYHDLNLYNFADNHDVSRVASSLTNPAHLYPLYLLLFTAPGAPSVYQGSEWGIPGVKGKGDDWHLRPSLSLQERGPHPDLAQAIARFARLRRELPALRHGGWERVIVNPMSMAFKRKSADQEVLVLVNAGDQEQIFELQGSGRPIRAVDLLNDREPITLGARRTELRVAPCWGRVLRIGREP